MKDYQELYRDERDNLLDTNQTQSLDDYGRAVYATWRLSYTQLDDEAKSLLQVCSLLHHEGITEEMFKRAALSEEGLEDSELHSRTTRLLIQLGKRKLKWSSWHFREITNRLKSHSLIDYDGQSRTYNMHPLVQHWSRTTIDEDGLVTARSVITIIVSETPRVPNQDHALARPRSF